MSDSVNNPVPSSSVEWSQVALAAIHSPGSEATCPVCHSDSVLAAWNLVDLMSGEAVVDLICSACRTAESLNIVLPPEVSCFFPFERITTIGDVIRNQMIPIANRIRQHAGVMPAATFTTDPRWDVAGWSATTFQWHPTSEAPPIMGLVFDNAEAGKGVFADLVAQQSHSDRFEELRVSIIEGSMPGQQAGYTVHLCPDPESLAAYATAEDFVLNPRIIPFLGRWNRAYPTPGSPPLLPRFKDEFHKHKEFLLAPVTRRADGQLWVDVELGIVKNTISFRELSEIGQDDIDAAALVLPQLITPPL